MSHSAALRPGHLVAGKYRLERLLGTGGFGEVWVASSALHGELAIKFLHADLTREDIRARFDREAFVVGRLRSPHVVRAIDHGRDDEGRAFYAMELLAGESLEEHLARRGTLSPGELGKLLRQAALGLSEAHGAGVVHRDLKPANLFLTQYAGEVFLKILDFGIAKVAPTEGAGGSATSTGMLIGTPEYMSPEQAVGAKSLDARSDAFSLALVAYRCLCGASPFAGETFGQIIVNVSTAAPAPPSSIRPDLPPALDAWFRRALAKSPADRFDSVTAMVDAYLLAASTTQAHAITAMADTERVPPARTPVDRPGHSVEGIANTARGDTVVIPTRPAVPMFVIAGMIVAVLGGGSYLWLARAPAGPPTAAAPSSAPAPPPVESTPVAVASAPPSSSSSSSASASASSSAPPPPSGLGPAQKHIGAAPRPRASGAPPGAPPPLAPPPDDRLPWEKK